ncbi:NAD(P)H-dependent FMN reductase [Stackebrandtia albiflava]|uniref:NAD(P)H-dependent FMN reductase n=1 Tax=Stackebrandtia albiflava TaxID=406432 RepID=A0A562V9C4_9ACTN|nr:NAD(P)H-dependent oxidoreductase [Stackebrandtia albiflava]TWJ14496.1 NAD(P)H-dependent FMN reductase [Stackebrandtia albiflava]
MAVIGVIVGSTRPGRIGGDVGSWAAGVLSGVAEVDLIDLREVGLPFLDEPEHAGTGVYAHAHTRAWSRRVAALDAMLFVTPEYNGSFPAPLKNALDFLSLEWRDKPAGILAYGNTSSGTRAATALLPVLGQLRMLFAGSVFLPLPTRVSEAGLTTTERDAEALYGLGHRLTALTGLIAPAAA